MTALETIEYAQTSVDQIQHGLEVVQGHLGRADDLAIRVDDIVLAAGDVAKKARRVSRFVLVFGGVMCIGGIVAFVVLRARRKSAANEESADTRS
ncbi:MAG: hypothetical protein BMS9Abin17_1115 [Acidimicrobiia bacterium]|nr:MAG: hypothetical protein BMS9Abin17_1115 [Acidimicrobiia bacterium]